MNTSTLPALLQRFITDRLTAQLEACPNTIAVYRDTFRLLLRYASQRRNKPPTKLGIEDLDSALIGDFLTHVEKVRHNSARSRNTRVAAIRSFYRYVAMNAPEYALHCQRILAMPNKRYVRRTVNFIERHALTTLTVKDGSTAIVGGLVRNTVQHTATKVPVLGDLPLLGVFFRSTTDVLSKANLVIVLTPHIIRDEGDMKRVVGKRMEERQQFLDHYLLFKDDAAPPVGWNPARGHGLLDEIARDAHRVAEDRRLTEEASVRVAAVHEERAPLDLPSVPPPDAKAPAAASPTSTPGPHLLRTE